jgi:hypothetical protein
MPARFGGPGLSNSLGSLTSNRITLLSGDSWVPPSGYYNLVLGRYTQIQEFDPISQCWTPLSGVPQNTYSGFFDGFNQRLANSTGCAVAALLTAAGTNYTSAPTVTPSAGNGIFTAIMGQVVASATVTYGGSNYIHNPLVLFGVPPSPGIPATGYATVSGGVVTGITITNQGAGYTSPPQVVLVNDSRDTTGGGAMATAVLTGSGTVNAVVCNDFGTGGLTTVPTLTFSGGGGSGAAATAIMNLTVTGYTVTTAGAGYTAAAGNVWVSATPSPTAGTPAYTNPATQTGAVKLRQALISAPASGAGAITATGLFVIDGGSYEAIPATGSVVINGGTGIVTTAAVLALTVGGATDDGNFLYPG